MKFLFDIGKLYIDIESFYQLKQFLIFKHQIKSSINTIH
jgi:hypothetical protein